MGDPKPLKSLVKKEIRIVLNKDNIGSFKRLEHARPIDEANLASLVKALKAGVHFETPLCFNDLSTGSTLKGRVIDGGHRLTAIARVINDDPAFSIEVLCHVYEHLDDAAERKVYDTWNAGRRESIADRIHVNQVDYPLLLSMQKWFPAPVVLYGPKRKQRAFRFVPLVQAYLNRLSPWRRVMRTVDFLERAKLLGDDAYEYLKDFGTDFIEGVGDPTGDNFFARPLGLEVTMKIHACNIEAGTLERKDIVQRWRAKVSNDPTIRNMIATSSIVNIPTICDLAVAAMNRGYFRHLALTPTNFAKRVEEAKRRTKDEADEA